MVSRTVLVAALLWAGVRVAGAQGVPAPPEPAIARVRMGPLWINPTLALTNSGVDTNVFNEAEAPDRDLTMTVTPAAQLWMPLGPTWLTGEVREDIVWFKDFVDERSADGRYTAGWLVPLTRVGFYAGSNWVNTRERPGFEIDARAKRREHAYLGAVEVRALARTLIGVRGERREVDFDEDEFFLGVSLHEALSRTYTEAALTIRHELTPLTSFTIDLAQARDRFKVSPLRDSDSMYALLGVRFDPAALINGSAQVGVRDFAPADPALPPYQGVIASLDLSYVAFESSRFAVRVGRDVNYSFDVDQPYYLQTGVAGSVTQQIFGPVDVQGRLGRQRLFYRNRETGGPPLAERVDRVIEYGGGIGYRAGRDLRVGLNVDRQKRSSMVLDRSFDGLRYGISATYGVGL
jgi:hypothetical protein